MMGRKGKGVRGREVGWRGWGRVRERHVIFRRSLAQSVRVVGLRSLLRLNASRISGLLASQPRPRLLSIRDGKVYCFVFHRLFGWFFVPDPKRPFVEKEGLFSG